MEEAFSAFQSVVEAKQHNGGPHKQLPQAENENPARRKNQEQVVVKYIKRCKGVEIQTISIGVEVRS